MTDAPLASGVASVIVPTLIVELNPPPFGWAGGCSSVVPSTVTEQGTGAAPQVIGSVIPATTTADEVRGRRSDMPEGEGKVLTNSKT